MIPDGRVANLLTFDIEGFIEASHDSLHVPGDYVSSHRQREEIEVNTCGILELLEAAEHRATLFVLGRIARDLPALVRQIVGAGHELACHSFQHRRLYHFSAAEVRSFLGDAKSVLEDVSGQRVQGFRAPDFSITKANAWTFDILRDLGFTCDSSVYPTSLHDVYGIGDFPRVPFRMANGLVEFPMSTARILGANVPFGGGGYLRFYPLALTRWLCRHANRAGVPVIVYFHPSEMGTVVLPIRELDPVRRVRTYGGIASAAGKLRALLRSFHFIRMVDYLDRYPVHEPAA